MRKKGYVLALVLLMSLPSFAQSSADFLLPATSCLNEAIKITNQSQNAIAYEWDFCQGDFSKQPIADNLGSLAGSGSQGVKLIFDGTNWFGFIVTKDENSIIRLDFGANLDNPSPTKINLGDINGTITKPMDFDAAYVNGNWYGFVYSESATAFSRIDFGPSLTTPVNSLIVTPILTDVAESSHSGFDLVASNGKWYLVYARPLSVKVARLATIVSIPTGADILSTPTDSNFGVLGDIKTTFSNGNWFGYSVSVGGRKVFRFTFGSDIFSIPTYQDITGSWLSSATPIGLDIGIDVAKYYLIISTTAGIARVNLGSDLTSAPTGEFLGNLSVLPQTNKIDLVKHQSKWRAFTCATFSSNLFRISFPDDPCNNPVSEVNEPIVEYSSIGNKGISLRAYDDAVNYSEANKEIIVSALPAPEIDFSHTNVCVSSVIEFTSQSPQVITNYSWSFGDTNTSPDPNPTHQFAIAEDYTTSLHVLSNNGCNNYIEKTVSIFEEPNADFVIPSASPYCSNQNYLFDNTSIIDPGYPVAWQWKVNGVDVSSNEDLNFAFTSTTNQDISLTASIPGCENEVIKSISTLLEGPVPDFSFSGQCEDENVTFTNSSSGTIDVYAWNFDDGSPNVPDTNPTHVFSTIGVYDVVLTASNTTTGCNNTKTKSISVYSKPVVNFLLSPPPFSCNGTPSQFNDLTPNPPDSNIASWAWNFGDAGSSQNTSTVKNPQHTYANPGGYNVSLLVTTNFFCSATLQLPVTISQSPIASFNFGPTCEDVPVNFTDSSFGTIVSWDWLIGSTVYSTRNPTHTFVNPGTANITLSVTASNNCIGTVSTSQFIPQKLTPDFSLNRNCVNQQTVFTDITNAAADPVSSQRWNFGALGTANGSPVNFTFPNTGIVPVTLTITTQEGCVYPISKSVNIISSPQANFTPTPLAGAPPLSVLFTNTSISATSYQWAFHDQNNSTSTAVSPTFVYHDLGEYQAELTASNAQNCFHTTSKTIRVVQPVVDVALGGLELMEFQNGFKPAVTIFNNGNVPIINLSLLLNMSGPVIRERVSAIITPNTSYRHVLSFEFPATTDIDYFCIEAEVTDITPNDNEVCLGLEQSFITFPPYPNPSKGSFQLDWITKEPGIVNLTVINSMGQEERNLQIESVEGLNPLILETYGLSAGVYFVRIKYQQFTKLYRVFVSE